MRIVELLATLDDDTIDRLSHHHLGVGEAESRAVICVNLENVLRSPKHVRETIYNLQPPAFRILERLLDTEGHTIPLTGLRESAMEETFAIAKRVTSGEILGRDEGLRLYRRVLAEARRNDLELDASETALLGVLRLELGIRQVEHFLIEHHEELHQFWNTDHAFLDVLTELRTSGLAYATNGELVFPEELVGIARQIVGLEASWSARKRLYERLAGQDTAVALGALKLKTSGSKDEKAQRLLEHYIQPTEALASLPLSTLRDLCRDLELSVGGAKDELVERIASHFALGYDIRPKPEAPPPPPREPRTLPPGAFIALFGALRAQDLSDILTAIGSSRVTGAKDHLVRLVLDSHHGEESLLMELDMRQLESALVKHRLKTSGPKREKVQRLLEWFAAHGEKHAQPPESPGMPASDSDEAIT